MKYFSRHKIDIFFIVVIIVISLFFRISSLNVAPPNITGDETHLTDIYKILFTNDNYFWSFFEDGSVAGIQFYWMAIFVKLFPLSESIFASRISIGVLSVISLVTFYIFLKQKTSPYISFIITILLSANYVFLNFSRTAWINMFTICFGMFTLLFLDLGLTQKKARWYLLSGFFAGVMLFGYQYGRLLFIFLCIYLIGNFFKKKYRTKKYLRNVLLFIFIAILTFSPFLIAIIKDNGKEISRRSHATYAFTPHLIKYYGLNNLIHYQLEQTFRGLIFLDGNVFSNGHENLRYVPYKTSIVNPFIRVLFFISFIYIAIFYKKLLSLWLTVFFSTILIVVLTDSPPNTARALFFIPFIYYLIGITIYSFTKNVCNNNKFKLSEKIVVSGIVIISVYIFLYDTTMYFKWMDTTTLRKARQPALNYDEFPAWQNYQIQRIKKNQRTIVNQEWYEIRKTLR